MSRPTVSPPGNPPGNPAWTGRGMVTAPRHLAARAGRDVLGDGGNAVGAAVGELGWLLGHSREEDSATLKLQDGFDARSCEALAAAGHDVGRVGPPTATMGHAKAILRHPDGLPEGATDPCGDRRVAAW